MNDVVEVIELEDGQKVLHGVPDEKTKEHASMVRGQKTSRVSQADREKSPQGTPEVSDYSPAYDKLPLLHFGSLPHVNTSDRPETFTVSSQHPMRHDLASHWLLS